VGASLVSRSGTSPGLHGWRRSGQIALLAVGLAGLVPKLVQPVTPSIAYTVAGLVFAFTGWLLTHRRPENGIGWCFLGVWAIDGLFNVADVLQHHAAQTEQLYTWWAWLGGWLVAWLFGPLLFLATTLPLLLFPEGLAGRRWRYVAWVGAGAAVVTVVLEMVSPKLGYFLDADQIDPTYLVSNNPLSPSFLAEYGPADDWLARNLAIGVIAATAVVAAVGLVLRGRRSSGVERLQFRWVTYGAALMALLIVTTLPFPDSSGFAQVTWPVALATLPVTTAIAILRFRLYEIDRVISRTTSYAIVTGILLVIYAAVVTTATRLLPDSSTLAVAAATLVAAALARPLHRRVQHGVDRRFNRARYDAQQTVEGFGARLRHEIDTTVVSDDLVQVVHTTLQPDGVVLWLRP
jgi:hypothetical protein